MRIPTLLLSGLLLALPAFAAERTFAGRGASEAQACDDARAQAKQWAARGKSEGRERGIADYGTCACTETANGFECRTTATVTDEQYEAEEDR
jgi:hypothetical protein